MKESVPKIAEEHAREFFTLDEHDLFREMTLRTPEFLLDTLSSSSNSLEQISSKQVRLPSSATSVPTICAQLTTASSASTDLFPSGFSITCPLGCSGGRTQAW